MAKNSDMTKYLAIFAILALVFGAFTGWTFNPSDFNGGSKVIPATSGGEITNPADGVIVTKQLKVTIQDELAGGAVDGTTNSLVIYDSTGKVALETCTLSSGAATSANTYRSGTRLWLKYYYDTTIDSYKYWNVEVPTMGPADAESLTTNAITLKTREAGAYTDSLISSTGLTITDGVGLNTTGSTNDTMTLTYSFYTTTDNTGYPSFRDPTYGVDMKNVLWATLSGTGYETVSLTGFDGAFEKGSSMYYYKIVSDDSVSKWKSGNDYVYPGTGAVSFGFNAAGFSNSTTSYPTLQLYLKIYSSPEYMQQYGDYGPYDFTAAEQTMLIYDI